MRPHTGIARPQLSGGKLLRQAASHADVLGALAGEEERHRGGDCARHAATEDAGGLPMPTGGSNTGGTADPLADRRKALKKSALDYILASSAS